jgi:hypothetical protein
MLNLTPNIHTFLSLTYLLALLAFTHAQGEIDPAKNVFISRFLSTTGTGNSTDLALVAGQLSRLPISLLERVSTDANFTMLACKNNITDWPEAGSVIGNLSRTPGGYTPNSTYANVQGIFFGGKNTVVVAVTTTSGRILTRSMIPGSASVPLHELGHYIDYNWGGEPRNVISPTTGHRIPGDRISDNATFAAAWSRDQSALEPYYDRTAGDVGQREAFAEYFGQAFNAPINRDCVPNILRWVGAWLTTYGYEFVVGNEGNSSAPTCRQAGGVTATTGGTGIGGASRTGGLISSTNSPTRGSVSGSATISQGAGATTSSRSWGERRVVAPLLGRLFDGL